MMIGIMKNAMVSEPEKRNVRRRIFADYIIAIDIGGTKTGIGIVAPVCELATNTATPAHASISVHTQTSTTISKLVASTSIPTQPEQGCESLVRRVYDASQLILEQCGISYNHVIGVGAVSPGPLDLNAGKVIHIPTMGWRDVPIAKIIEDVFARPVALQGDTAGAALGEYAFGCDDTKPKCLVYITVSTGVGCGIIIDGNVYNGAYDMAGELGHYKIFGNESSCPCGGTGCLETIASGTGISRLATELIGEHYTAKEVFQRARAGDTACNNIVEKAGNALGVGIAALMQLLDPQVVILGGSVANNFAQLEPHITQTLGQLVQNYHLRKTIIRNTLLPNGHNALLGAGMHLSRLLT